MRSGGDTADRLPYLPAQCGPRWVGGGGSDFEWARRGRILPVRAHQPVSCVMHPAPCACIYHTYLCTAFRPPEADTWAVDNKLTARIYMAGEYTHLQGEYGRGKVTRALGQPRREHVVR